MRTVYNQWTQFECFPEFMEGVERVNQLDDTCNHWVVKIGGIRREFDTEITEQIPDERVRFKDFIESQPAETGAWRGEVKQDPTS